MPMDNPTPARPRTPEEIARLPQCPDVVEAAIERQITNIVHFTTMKGVTGILAKNMVRSRERLPHDEYLEHVYSPNVNTRKDEKWLDYVNLSITRINDNMFGASERWHIDEYNPWAVLSFKPEILGHPGVVFTTTNNIYPACRRAEGLCGFEQLFADFVLGRHNTRHNRDSKPANWPTDRQAEVLYPGELSCDYLQRIDVQLGESVDAVCGILGGLGLLGRIEVRHAPEVFI